MMRPAPWNHLEPFRVPHPTHGGPPGARYGAFQIPHAPTGVSLRVIASDGKGWEHVSVSLPNRTPNWREMEAVCRLFWHEEEAVMQLHPPRSQWVSNHPYCLPLWKPVGERIPMPPSLMVGIPGLEREFDLADPREAKLAHLVAMAVWKRDQ